MPAVIRRLACLFTAVALAGCNVTSDSALSTTKKPNEDSAATNNPEIDGEDIDGKNLKLSDYRGKVVMLDFWGNW